MSFVEVLCYFVLVPLMVVGVALAVSSLRSKSVRYKEAASFAGHALHPFNPRGQDTDLKGNVPWAEQRRIYLAGVSAVGWEIAATAKDFKGTPEGMNILCSKMDEEARKVFTDSFWKTRNFLDKPRPKRKERITA